MITYCHDTRTLQPGEYYVAIRGERHDGHDFVPDALQRGAAGLVVEREPAAIPGLTGGLPANIEVIRVPDTLLYLAQQAQQRLQSLGSAVVAITGSVGKTTTKRAIVAVLQEAFPVVTPQGNWNTLLGLSLTVLNHLTRPEEKFVAEIGIYYAGEIAEICRFIQPTVGVVLNVQPVHLDTLGTIENVARAKGELAEAVPPHGTACLNADDPRVRAMASRCRGRVLLYGSDPAAEMRPERVQSDIPLLGPYRTTTALAALSVGSLFGMTDAAMNRGLARLTPEKGRLVRLPGIAGTTLIDDTYNASLASSLAALETLRTQPATRRIAFLGDMLELGSTEAAAHETTLERALAVADQLILVGPRLGLAASASPTAQAAQRAGRLAHFADVQAAADALAAGTLYQPQADDLLLFKGSASMRIERLVALFLSPEVDARAVLVRQEPGWRV